MAELPAMPLWVRDFVADTQHLSCTERGAYIALLMAMWLNDGALPNEPKKLARICGLTQAQWAKMAGTIGAFFTIDGDQLTQKRLTVELKNVRSRRQLYSRLSEQGNRSRWGDKSLKNLNPIVPSGIATGPATGPATGSQAYPYPDSIQSNPTTVPVPARADDKVAGAAGEAYARKIQAEQLPGESELRVRLVQIMERAGLMLHDMPDTGYCRQWLQRGWHPDDCVAALESQMALNPKGFRTLGYLDKRIEGVHRNRQALAQGHVNDAERQTKAYQRMLEDYLVRRTWAPMCGPRPGAAGCRVPAAIVEQFRERLIAAGLIAQPPQLRVVGG